MLAAERLACDYHGAMRVSLRTIRLVASVAFLASAAGLPPLAQTTPTAAPFQNQFPDPVRYKAPIPEAAELRLGEVTEIPLNGPLYSGPVM